MGDPRDNAAEESEAGSVTRIRRIGERWESDSSYKTNSEKALGGVTIEKHLQSSLNNEGDKSAMTAAADAWKTTLVTMYFDLKALADRAAATRPLEFYLEHGRKVLSVRNPLVVFCDSKTRPLIQDLRDSLVDPGLAGTIYVERNITEYDYYKNCLDIIHENRLAVPSYVGHRNTPSYFLVSMFKVHAMREALRRNDFGTSHYAWLDLGCFHVLSKDTEVADVEAALTAPLDGVRACYIHYRARSVLGSDPAAVRDYCNQGPCGIAAGFFTASAAVIPRWFCAMNSIFYEQLSRGYGHSEETVLTYCFDRYPELFNVFWGDYYSLVKNYHFVQADSHAVRWHFIQNCLEAGRRDLAAAAALSVLEGYSRGRLELHQGELESYRFIAGVSVAAAERDGAPKQ